MTTCARKQNRITIENLAAYDKEGGDNAACHGNGIMARFHGEHDQYRHFLVVGSTRAEPVISLAEGCQADAKKGEPR